MCSVVRSRLMLNVALVIGCACVATQAHAGCLPSKLFSTYNFDESVYYYVHWAPDSQQDTDVGVGAIYQPGLRSARNEGTYALAEWLREDPAYGWYVSGELGAAGVEGCIEDEMVVAVSDPSPQTRSDFFVAHAFEDRSASAQFLLGPDLTFRPIPAPRVLDVTEDGTDRLVDLEFDDPSWGYYTLDDTPVTAVIREIVLFQNELVDPGRDASAWPTPIARLDYVGGVTRVDDLRLDCSGARDLVLAATLNLTNEYDLPHVSTAVSIDCDGSAFPPDTDGDGVDDTVDNCPFAPNADQFDLDADGRGDPCDPCPIDPANDADGDSHCESEDNCPVTSNPDQADGDGDGTGSACDNCPDAFNPDQADFDGDGDGDLCDPFPDRPDNYTACLETRQWCLDEVGRLESRIETCQTELGVAWTALQEAELDLEEGLEGLAEIDRLLRTPFGKRSTTFECSGALCPDLMRVIDRLLNPPGASAGNAPP